MARPPYPGDEVICPRCGALHPWFRRETNGRTCKDCVRKRSLESNYRTYEGSPRRQKALARSRKRLEERVAERNAPGPRECNTCHLIQTFPEEFCKGKNHWMCLRCLRGYTHKSNQTTRLRMTDPVAYDAYVRGLYRNRIKPEIDTSTTNGRLMKRRLESESAIGKIPRAFFAELLEKQNGICASPVCEKDIRSQYDIDHIMPLSLGGTDEPENFQLLCATCNRRKNNKHPAEWLHWLRKRA